MPELKITQIKIADLKPAEYNPRKISEEELNRLVASIKEFGMVDPVIVNKDMTVIGGHQRIKAAERLGFTEVPCNVLNLNKTQEKILNLALNKIGGEWDDEQLMKILQELETEDGLDLTGFTEQELRELERDNYMDKFGDPESKEALTDDFVIPPFSVFDTRQGYWRARVRVWDSFTKDHGETRKALLADGKNNPIMRSIGDGTSLFDPVIAEVCYRWFMPPGKGKILDPFAGGPTRGIVAAMLGKAYTGIDLRPDQVDTNVKKWELIEKEREGEQYPRPRWLVGDANDVNKLLKKDEQEQYDFIFTCPPYYDLEKYSDDPKDLSNFQTYEEFMASYTEIFKRAAAYLKPNRFMAIVVGDIRDKTGNIRNFVGDNVAALKAAGLVYYNEIVIINAVGPASIRARRTFRTRKTCKAHQNVLVFYKGEEPILGEDTKAAVATIKPSKLSERLKGFEKLIVFYKGDPDKIKGDFPAEDIGEEAEFMALANEVLAGDDDSLYDEAANE